MSNEGSTGRLLQLCLGYYVFYVITGVAVKYFGSSLPGLPDMGDIEFSLWSTLGGTLIATGVVLAARWYRISSVRMVTVLGRQVPIELLYIVPSGVCTAVIIPTTTLMYTLPISVMIAMVIMRGCVIVISRVVDAIQIHQGILQKKVPWEENVAVVFAILAVGVTLRQVSKSGKDEFAFLHNQAAMTILISYVIAYALRIYIMNYYKNTRGKGVPHDNRPFFGIEQLTAAFTLLVVTALVYASPTLLGLAAESVPQQITDLRATFSEPHPMAHWAIVAGLAYGMVAFFSVFLFMFKGRTATFAGLVNRLTSLVAGTTATLAFWLLFDETKKPKPEEWWSLGYILVAVAFLSKAESRRAREAAAARNAAP